MEILKDNEVSPHELRYRHMPPIKSLDKACKALLDNSARWVQVSVDDVDLRDEARKEFRKWFNLNRQKLLGESIAKAMTT